MSWSDLQESVVCVAPVTLTDQATGSDSGKRNFEVTNVGRSIGPAIQESEAKMSWTDERVELLRQLWQDGKSASHISRELGEGTTRNAVIGKVHRLGLSGRSKTNSPAPPRVRHKEHHAPEPRESTPRYHASSAGRAVSGNNALAISIAPMLDAKPVRYEDVVVPMSLRVTIVELREAMCRWPLGDPASSEFRYCGSPAPGSGPYCCHHGEMAYQPAQDRRRDRDRRALPG
jgi:GcrA cell cycle regulator